MIHKTLEPKIRKRLKENEAKHGTGRSSLLHQTDFGLEVVSLHLLRHVNSHQRCHVGTDPWHVWLFAVVVLVGLCGVVKR